MMTERRVGIPSWDILEAEIYQAMGYGSSRPEEPLCQTIKSVFDEAVVRAAPCVMYEVRQASMPSRRQLQVDEVLFSPGGIIGSYMSGMTHVCLFVATAGVGYDAWVARYKSQGDILGEYIADSIGTVLVEHCVGQLGQWLEQECPVSHSLPYSPGYCGWDILEQRLLFSLFPDRPCGVRLSDSCLMWPIKSVSGFIALGQDLVPQPYRCEICKNTKCYKRR